MHNFKLARRVGYKKVYKKGSWQVTRYHKKEVFYINIIMFERNVVYKFPIPHNWEVSQIKETRQQKAKLKISR